MGHTAGAIQQACSMQPAKLPASQPGSQAARQQGSQPGSQLSQSKVNKHNGSYSRHAACSQPSCLLASDANLFDSHKNRGNETKFKMFAAPRKSFWIRFWLAALFVRNLTFCLK